MHNRQTDKTQPVGNKPNQREEHAQTTKAISSSKQGDSENSPQWLYQKRKFKLFLGALGASGLAVLAFGLVLNYFERDLPDPREISGFARRGTITIKASDNTILQQVGPATHEKLEISETPPRLIEAFIAAEDRRFYKHSGIDQRAIVRAFFANIFAGELVEGASTITQQLARMVFLSQEPTLTRKIREARLAQKIEQEMTKEDILEYYLNFVYLGAGAYGVTDAAWVYFSKELDELTLPEIATIAGMPAAPSDYSPVENPDLARKRRNVVLQRMATAGFISQEEADTASSKPVNLKLQLPKRLDLRHPYFTTFITQELNKHLSADQIEQGGLTVETSVNVKWQEIGERVVKEAVEYYGYGNGFEEAALVAVDPRNGEVKALVGGTDFDSSQFNRVTQAHRQPGSTFKGIVYTTAIAAGKSPYDSYEDAPIIVDGYEPLNFGRKHSGWLNLRDALSRSVNTIAVKLLMDVGFDPTMKVAKDMGIKSELKPYFPLALGAFEVTLLELTNAYATLANQGEFIEAHGIRRILNSDGEVLYEAKSNEPEQAIDEDSASIMTWMLENVVNGGTGGPAQLDRPVAGKTGTSDEARDLWFVGYIPQLVTGVWLGNDDNYPTVGSSSTAAVTWHDFMSEVVEPFPVQEFPELPEFDGREGTIAAKPVELGEVEVIYGQSKQTENSTAQNESGEYYETRYDDGYDNYSSYDDGGGSYSNYSESYSDGGGYYDDGGSYYESNDSYYAPSNDYAPAPEPYYSDYVEKAPAASEPAYIPDKAPAAYPAGDVPEPSKPGGKF